MNKAYYWKTFGKTKINNDDRRFLDTNEKIPDNLVNQLTEIFSNDFETDDSAYNSYKVYSGKKGLELNKEMQSSSKYFVPVTGNEKWFRAKAKMFYWDKEWNFWWGTQFIIQLIKDDEIVKTKLIRVHRISEPNNWQEIYVDIKAEGKTFNKVAVSVWNANGDKTIYVDDLKIFSAN